MGFYSQIQKLAWWAMTDSNRRHLRCKRSLSPPAPANISSGTLLKGRNKWTSPAISGSRRFTEPQCTSSGAAIVYAAGLAIAIFAAAPAVAGGTALGGPPDGWGGGYSGGPSQPDRDRINDETGGPCSSARVKYNGDWYCGWGNALRAILEDKRQEPEPEPTPVVDPIPDLERPGEGIPGGSGDEPQRPTQPGTPDQPGEPPAPSPVPIPAAGWLLAGALAAWGAIRRFCAWAITPVDDTCPDCGGALASDLPFGQVCPDCEYET